MASTADAWHRAVKSAALVAAVFVVFPQNKCNFLHKNKFDIVYGGSNSSQGDAL